MKWSLWEKIRLANGMFVSGLILVAISYMFDGRVFLVLSVLGMVLMVSGLVLKLKWWHCPHCHSGLGRGWKPNFCSNCGEKIDWDAKSEE